MKKYLLTVNYILLFVYFIYALSPLAYDNISTHPEHPDCLCQPSKIIKLYAVDVLLSTVALNGQKTDDDASSQDHILVRKKKALRTSVVKLIAQLSLLSTKRADLCPSQAIWTDAALTAQTRLNCPQGYEFLHSGTSPPSA